MNKTQAQTCAKLADFPQEVWDKLDKERKQMRHIEGETETQKRWRQ